VITAYPPSSETLDTRNPLSTTKKHNLRKLRDSHSHDRINSNQINDANLDSVHQLIFREKIHRLIGLYSGGLDLPKLREETIKLFDGIELSWTDNAVKFKKGIVQYDQYWLNSYCHMIWLLSLSFLLKIPTKQINILKKIITNGNINDELIIFLLSSLTDKIYPNTKQTTYNPFKWLVKNGIGNNNSNSIKKYLGSWHSRSKLLTWHRYLNSAPERFYYFGYWSFEAAAITTILDIDHTKFMESKYYPSDLVEYYKNKM